MTAARPATPMKPLAAIVAAAKPDAVAELAMELAAEEADEAREPAAEEAEEAPDDAEAEAPEALLEADAEALEAPLEAADSAELAAAPVRVLV